MALPLILSVAIGSLLFTVSHVYIVRCNLRENRIKSTFAACLRYALAYKATFFDFICGFRRRNPYHCANILGEDQNSWGVLLSKQRRMFAIHFDFCPNASFSCC